MKSTHRMMAAVLLAGIVVLLPRVTLGQAVPKITGPYVAVYRPAGDTFAGPDTVELKAGAYYAEWVANDHAIVLGPDGRWHALGITHPLTSPANIHDGEFQSFHARAPQGRLTEVLRDGVWTDLPKVLPPSERPGEIRENHAPTILAREHEYIMIYGPSPIRWATSQDLQHWQPRGVLFEEAGGTRDPHVLLWQGTYYMVYCTADRVQLRTSTDLVQWSSPHTVLTMKDNIAPESPSLVRYGDTFYLFVCGWNGIWDRQSVAGAYQHVTYVYQSTDPLRFEGRRPLTQLDAHAPEVFQDEAGDWFISSAEWPERGVSLARLVWE